MSKPNPRLSKGLVRTLAQAPSSASSTHSHALQLTPVVSQHSYSTASTSSSSSATSKYSSISSGFNSTSNRLSSALSNLALSAGSSTASSSYVSLLPTWDSPFSTLGLPEGYAVRSGENASVVMPYRSSSGSQRMLSRSRGTGRPREYTTATAPSRQQANFDAFGHSSTSSAQTLFFDKSSFASFGTTNGSLNDFSTTSELITYPSPQPEKPPRHYLLSPSPYSSNDSPTSYSIAVNPYIAYPQIDPSPILPPPPPTSTDATSLNLYSSNLVFHLGASGLAKERPPPSRSSLSARTPAPPPRPRSFPLPEVSTPTTLHSTGVGEDAYFTRMDGMCIADGVGGWARSGRGDADAGRWSRLLTHFCEAEVGSWWAGDSAYLTSDATAEAKGKIRHEDTDDHGPSGWARKVWKRGAREHEESGKRRPLDPVEIMQRGFEKCLACVTAEGINGSSTCLLALLHHSTLLVANLGDCCLLLIRHGQVVFRTSEMQHAFNFPLQVGTHSRDEPMKDAQRFDVGVGRGDIVILGSDGLMDNLYDEEILDTLAEFAPPSSNVFPTPPNSRPSSPGSLPPFSPQKVSEALCRRARMVSEQTTATTPFMERAIEEGIDFVGGKKDDISVLVGVIGDREPGKDVGGLALHAG